MPTYQITARNSSAQTVIAVSISAIDQELPVHPEIDVVNAVRSHLAGLSDVSSVTAQKYEQVISTV